MDFFESQDAARQKTGRLVFLFGLAVVSIIVSVYVVVSGAFLFTTETEEALILALFGGDGGDLAEVPLREVAETLERLRKCRSAGMDPRTKNKENAGRPATQTARDRISLCQTTSEPEARERPGCHRQPHGYRVACG